MTAACVGMIACSKDGTGDNPYADGSKQVVLKVNLPATRAVDGTWLDGNGAPQKTTISSMDVYFTNANGTVQEHHRIAGNYLEEIKTGLRFVDLTDVSAVYIIANQPEASAFNGQSMADYLPKLRELGPSLEQNDMIFAGCDVSMALQADTDTNIPTYDPQEGETYPGESDMAYTAEITLRPLISRIEWGTITVADHGETDPFEFNNKTYKVKWENWKPVLSGIYQSNIYVAERIFADTKVGDNVFFETPANTTAIAAGAWKNPSTTIDNETWEKISDVLVHTGTYTPGQTDSDHGSYGPLLTADYVKGKCVPFHFFVPFDPSVPTLGNDNLLPNTPRWHFQFYYPDPTNGGQNPYTITVYRLENENWVEVDPNDDDDALAIKGEYMYPVRTDGLAYANVVNLLDETMGEGSSNKNLKYQPGQIYTADVTISPNNVTPGFETLPNYNVIVKVGVADFATKEVTPEFDKQ